MGTFVFLLFVRLARHKAAQSNMLLMFIIILSDIILHLLSNNLRYSVQVYILNYSISTCGSYKKQDIDIWIYYMCYYNSWHTWLLQNDGHNEYNPLVPRTSLYLVIEFSWIWWFYTYEHGYNKSWVVLSLFWYQQILFCQEEVIFENILNVSIFCNQESKSRLSMFPLLFKHILNNFLPLV